MRRLISGLIILLLSGSGTALAGVDVETSTIGWRTYNDQVLRDAKQANKPVFVFVYTQWCQWCGKYEKETLENKQIRTRLKTEFIPAVVDYDLDQELALKLGTRLVPTSLILTPEGKRIIRFYGMLTPKELEETLTQALLSWSQGNLPRKDFGDERTCCPLKEGGK